MAREHLPVAPLNCSSLVSVVKFSARKLIIFVLVQLVLSPFILITADSLSGSINNNGTPAQNSEQPFGFNSNVTMNTIKMVKCTDAITILTNTTAKTVTITPTTKRANGNSILKQSENDTNGWRPYDVNLSLTGNASIHNQSERTIIASDSKRMNQNSTNFNESNERVLSRKRRYLIFPPGSSVQIVYDTYHPIVDYSNYLVMGITAAMAWELPSQPVYLTEELQNKYEMGELPLLHRNDPNVKNSQYVHPSKKYANIANSMNSNSYYTNIPKEKFYAEKNQYESPYKVSYDTSEYNPLKSVPSSPSATPTNQFQSYISYVDELMKQFKKLTEHIPENRPLRLNDFQEFANIITNNVKTERKSNSKNTIPKEYYNHIVHPVFKKRSIDELTPLEKFDLKLHRNSRHALYKQINTFLKTQGSDGHECILKMLCETGQRRHHREPGSMVIELLRTVFTLPEPVEFSEKVEHRMYDEAHASIDDCQKLYPKCEESVWNSKYM